jgi:superfamily II DNA or RNA helicase
MSFEVGSIVRARGREWVVLPSSDQEILAVRPLVGSPIEQTGILHRFEKVEPASFDLPGSGDLGDFFSAKLLREAARISARSTVGPFRSLGRIAVSPRPYQIVPLLMALRLDPVRLLIADDVGIGKTIEGLLIARELLDRGEITRMTVLCPPPLAEQWGRELASKFHIEAELVLASSAARLERACPQDRSLFQHYPFTVVSLDYIKSDRHREEFIRTCPELVIVDEAHSCAPPADQSGRGARHQRYQLLKELSGDPDRHIVFTTATPHSGNAYAFDHLIELLDPALVASDDGDRTGRRLARHFVQRRRPDIQHYLDEDTQFPERVEAEATYSLKESSDYQKLMRKAIGFVQKSMQEGGSDHSARIRWWSGLGLLRALGSSPRAAAATMRNRAAAGATDSAGEADMVGRQTVLDEDVTEAGETMDVNPGAQETDASGEAGDPGVKRRREVLLEMARDAEKIGAKGDPKLQRAVVEIKKLVGDGFSPIVFCRFIETAHYVGEELRRQLGKGVQVVVVTGELPPEEREDRIEEIDLSKKRLMVATDCLSEGVNLQSVFDAVVHYDLSWNPTRHEQREGRVDRFGQEAPQVRALTIYGADNPVDGLVLDVLIKKHKVIRSKLNVSIPVPMDTNDVLNALLEGLVLRAEWGKDDSQLEFPELAEELKPKREALHAEWDRSAEQEKASRSRYAQHTLKPEEVKQELRAAREGAGDTEAVFGFARTSLESLDVPVVESPEGFSVQPDRLPASIAHLAPRTKRGRSDVVRFCRRPPCATGTMPLERTSPLVQGLADLVLDRALSGKKPARRAAVTRTNDVSVRTTLLLVRYRYRLASGRGSGRREEICEETLPLAFRGSPEAPEWLGAEEGEALLSARPSGNVPAEQGRSFLGDIRDGYWLLRERVLDYGHRRAEALKEAHERVREAARGGRSTTAELQGEPDILGLYLFLPVPGGAR